MRSVTNIEAVSTISGPIWGSLLQPNPIIRSFHNAQCKSENNHCILCISHWTVLCPPIIRCVLSVQMGIQQDWELNLVCLAKKMHCLSQADERWLLLVRHTSTCWLCSSTMWFWWPALWKQVVVLFGGSSRSSRMRNSGHLRRRPTTLMDHCLPPCFCISPPHAHCLSSIAFLTHKCGDLWLETFQPNWGRKSSTCRNGPLEQIAPSRSEHHHCSVWETDTMEPSSGQVAKREVVWAEWQCMHTRGWYEAACTGAKRGCCS